MEPWLEHSFFDAVSIKEAQHHHPYQIARVIAQYKDRYLVDVHSDTLLSEVSGKFRFRTEAMRDFPTVGDYVMVEIHQDFAMIHHVLERKSLLERKQAGRTSDGQPIAANVDEIFICTSANQEFNERRMERYLTMAWQSGAIPSIVLTKSDLDSNIDSWMQRASYVAPFCKIIKTSDRQAPFDEELRQHMKPYHTYAFIGSSGVGKSSLINMIFKDSIIKTQEIGTNDKGRHTTTHRHIIESSEHFMLIDTPGMRELQLDEGDLNSSFSDIEAYAQECRFSDCRHEDEPGCAIRQAIEDGQLDPKRLISYRKLEKELLHQRTRQRIKDIRNKKNLKR